MPNPITSLKNIFTNPAGGPSGNSMAPPPTASPTQGFGTQSMPGSKVSPWVDYPLEAIQGAIGVGADTPANRFGQVAATLPFINPIRGGLGAVKGLLGRAAPEATGGILTGIRSAFTGGDEAISGLRSALPESFGPNATIGPRISDTTGAAYDPLALHLGGGPEPSVTQLPSPSTPPSAGNFPSVSQLSPSVPTSQSKRTSMGLDNPYSATPAYDYPEPEMVDSTGSSQQYDLHGGPPRNAGGNAGSTVGGDTLRKMGLSIPYGPPPR